MSDVAEQHDDAPGDEPGSPDPAGSPATPGSTKSSVGTDTGEPIADVAPSRAHDAEEAIDGLVDAVEQLDSVASTAENAVSDAQDVPSDDASTDADDDEDISAIVDAAFISLNELEAAASDLRQSGSSSEVTTGDDAIAEGQASPTGPVDDLLNEVEQLDDVAATAKPADDPVAAEPGIAESGGADDVVASEADPNAAVAAQFDSLVGDALAEQVAEMCATPPEAEPMPADASHKTVAATASADAEHAVSVDPEIEETRTDSASSVDAPDVVAETDAVESGEDAEADMIDFAGSFVDPADVVAEVPASAERVSLDASSTSDMAEPMRQTAESAIADSAATSQDDDPYAAPVDDDPYAAPAFDEPAADKEPVVAVDSPAVADSPADETASVDEDPYAAPVFDEPVATEAPTPATVEDDPYAAPSFDPPPAVEDDPYAAPSFDPPPAAEDDPYAAPSFDPPATETVAPADTVGTDVAQVAQASATESESPADEKAEADSDDAGPTTVHRLAELFAPIEPSVRNVLVPLSRPLRFVPRRLRGVVDVVALSLPAWVPIVWMLLWYLHR